MRQGDNAPAVGAMSRTTAAARRVGSAALTALYVWFAWRLFEGGGWLALAVTIGVPLALGVLFVLLFAEK